MLRLLLLLSLFVTPHAGEALLGFHDDGIHINGGSIGALTMEWPELNGPGNKSFKPTGKRHEGNNATLTYPDGTVLTLTISGGDLAVSFDRAPAGIDGWRCNTNLPSSLRRGGTWAFGDKTGEFPREKPPKPHLFQGTQSELRLTDLTGAALLITVPAYSFHQVQDNLEWGWDAFSWWYRAPLDKDHLKAKLSVRLDLSAVKSVVLVDELGQDARREFLGKAHGVADLAADKASEAAYWASFTGGPALDAFGGFADTGKRLGLKATGFFRLERKGGTKDGQWLLVDPAGNAFFQLGICSMGAGEDYTHTKDRTQAYAWLPPFEGDFRAAWHSPDYRARDNFSFFIANNIRKYGAWNPEARYDAMIDRVRAVGFNSSGAFGGVSDGARKKSWPWTPMFPLGTWNLGHQIPGVRGVFDPFDAEVPGKIAELFAKKVAPQANDPLIIGWFLENEQAFEDLPKVIPGLSSKQACKRRLVKELKKTHGDIAAFNKAWDLDAASFEVLGEMPLPVRTDVARADVHRFTGLLLDTYYQIIRSAFDQVDHNHLLIGNRWQPGTANDEQLVSTAAKHLDVISVNYYTYGIDRTFTDRIHTWSGGKPQMWTEFHWGSTAESGPPGRMDLPSQTARGKAYRNYVEGGAATGYVLGIQWFQLIDQPFTGRWFEGLNGEGYAVGLFTVTDRPYKDMLAQMAATNRTALYDVWLNAKPPFVFDDPRFNTTGGARSTEAQRPTGAMAMDGASTNWPGFPPLRIAPAKGATGNEASVKICYDAKHLYVLATVTDTTPQANNGTGDALANGDAIEVLIGDQPDSNGPLRPSDRRVILGASPAGIRTAINGALQPTIDGVVMAASDGKGWVLEAAIPWTAIGLTPATGATLRFDLTVIDGDGKRVTSRVAWSGGSNNVTDRSSWGRLLLAP
jgi:Carbohydrate family 9 binding domain-like